MRSQIVTAFALLLAACSRPEAPPPPPPVPTPAATTTWFICDGVDAPSLFLFEREGGAVRVAEYEKPSGAIVGRAEYAQGEEEGAAGSVYTPLLSDGAQAGAIRETNPGMLETPGAAYTPRITEVHLQERVVSCRWLPRTRLMGFTGRRSFVVHEDADGDLIYTTYDFASAANAAEIELSENGVSTVFSAEVRGGDEITRPDGVTFRFRSQDGYEYVVNARSDGQGNLDVLRNGAPMQSEPLIAFETGDAAGE